jgi:hypothetical protein
MTGRVRGVSIPFRGHDFAAATPPPLAAPAGARLRDRLRGRTLGCASPIARSAGRRRSSSRDSARETPVAGPVSAGALLVLPVRRRSAASLRPEPSVAASGPNERHAVQRPYIPTAPGSPRPTAPPRPPRPSRALFAEEPGLRAGRRLKWPTFNRRRWPSFTRRRHPAAHRPPPGGGVPGCGRGCRGSVAYATEPVPRRGPQTRRGRCGGDAASA